MLDAAVFEEVVVARKVRKGDFTNLLIPLISSFRFMILMWKPLQNKVAKKSDMTKKICNRSNILKAEHCSVYLTYLHKLTGKHVLYVEIKRLFFYYKVGGICT